MAEPTDTPELPPAGAIQPEPLRRALGTRYLQYALSTITGRALPDARDGLKPVHRRILYAMRELRLGPEGRYRKSSKIAGDVMGNYHPHGDAAIYDAMARLAQDFNVRYPLVDGQGNFGNIDGDNPAASRYTEARMTAAAAALLEGIDEDAVDFRDNYDGTLSEPVVLPAAFPNLLANGASGIAVGMATSIPPHNVAEICAAARVLIEAPDAPLERLLACMPGPDFPTGGVLIDPPGVIAEAYRTGRGALRLRALWHREDLGRGQWQIVVTEIPYQVQKARLVERLAQLVTDRKLPALADIRDESAEDIRLVIEPRSRSVDPVALMEQLFRQTELEIRFPLNMNVLIDGRVPKVCGLAELLRAWLDHRRSVLLRRARFRQDKIARRIEVLDGYIVAYLNLDRVIEIIRNEDEPGPVLMAEFGLTETQAEAILNMRLRNLRRLEEMALREERAALAAEAGDLARMLDSPALQWQRIREEIGRIEAAFGAPQDRVGRLDPGRLSRLKADGHPPGARRTAFAEAPQLDEARAETLVEREPITVVCSAMGWIRAMKGHLPLDTEFKFKDGDGPAFAFHAETTDRLVLAASDGRFFTLAADRLPGGRGMGEPVRLMADLAQGAGIVALFAHQPGARLLLAADDGSGFVVAESDVLAQTRAGKTVMTPARGARLAVCRRVQGDHVAVVGQNRKMLVFPLSELPEMSRGKGVRLQKYKDGGLSDARTLVLAEGLSWTEGGGRTRREPDLTEWLGRRGGAGRMAPRGFPRDNRFN
ncbi:MAG: DNA topoisomerase IV subunit A [Alphaproteobacteria bacterium]|nr:MAG: DNA topoisomerase IV subunit A [Alphaproteobacteria bacterium]